MGRMIPPYISDEVKSTGERIIFESLENDPGTDGWTVLHSLGLSRHVKRMYGEIDFVIIAPGLGIFCLEVKSGSVARKSGIWEFTNRYGEVSRKTRGPFEQAQEGMFSLIEAIKRKYGHSRYSRLLFGYGVMFPHIFFDLEGLEHEPWKIYDRGSRRRPVSDYIKALAYYERRKAEHESWFSESDSLPGIADTDELVKFLRGDFERLVSSRHAIDDREEEINRLTEEQFRCLDQLKANKRCLFTGAAGTGKTLLALEAVRRASHENKRTAMFCYNKMLGTWLSKEFPKSNTVAGGYAGTFHSFLFELAKQDSKFVRQPSDSYNQDFYSEDLPLMALQAIDQGVIQPFDLLVIDEGQDLITQEYLDVFDAILKGGLAGGNWQLFCDFERQAIYSSLASDQMHDMLEKRASFASFSLSVNCRNTRQIGEETSLLTGFDSPPFLPSKLEGPPVEYLFYEDNISAALIISKILDSLREERIPQGKVTILSPFKFTKSSVSGLDKSKYQVFDLSTHNDKLGGTVLTFSSIHAFKGLENSIIILCDVNRLNDEEMSSLLYVGMSRAKDRLYVLVDSAAKGDYYKMLKRSIS